jgi:Uma2 family endonuclease
MERTSEAWMGVVAERKRFTVDEYHKLGQAGVLGENDRIELVEGELIQMPPIGSTHASIVARLDRAFHASMPQGFVVWTQNPLSLPPLSEPQPDLALVKPRADDYLGSLPAASDVLLVIEVADTTLAYDRDMKIPLYARHGIPEAWLIDVSAARLEMHRDPGPEGYRTLLRPDRDAAVSPLALPDVSIDLKALLAGLTAR